MSQFDQLFEESFGASASGQFKNVASYFHDLDYVEYQTVDKTTVSERVDEFLTIIRVDKSNEICGFRFKGFKARINASLAPLRQLQDSDFLRIATVIEVLVKEIGDDLFTNDDRAGAYKAAYRLVKDHDVTLPEMPLAA